MKVYKCKQGQQGFKAQGCAAYAGQLADRRPRHKPDFIGWKVRFRDSCRYDHGDADQADWNKLPGLSWNLFTNHDDAVMLGWRWNTEKDAFELAPYLHLDGEPIHSFTEPVQVGSKETFWFAVGAYYGAPKAHLQIWFGDGSTKQYPPFWFYDLGVWARVIHAWFGGNKTAPHDMYLEYEQVTRWAQDVDGNWWPNELY